MHKTKPVKIGSVTIGNGNPVAVQSMTKTDSRDLKSTLAQIRRLEELGCEIIRVSIPDTLAAENIKSLKKQIHIPLVADIHYDYRLAVQSINNGADKIRINPGNIGSNEKLKLVVNAAKNRNIPIRIGLNSGSLPKSLNSIKSQETKFIKSAIDYIRLFESWDFDKTVISLKSTDVNTTISAYRAISKITRYPLHLGITESGPPGYGTVKSSIGIGILLNEGIGDTIRVSLTSEPEEEVKTAYQILQVLNLRSLPYEIISCPTCSRCKTQLVDIVKKLESELQKRIAVKKIKKYNKPVKIAVMGCVVNGPGEAKHVDIGIAGGTNTGLLFMRGKPIKKIPPSRWVEEILNQFDKLVCHT